MGREYALAGRTGGAAIVDVTDPASPRYVGVIPANASGARDLKVYADHLFFTGDGAGDHGLVVFDLTRLRDAPAEPLEFEPDAVYDHRRSPLLLPRRRTRRAGGHHAEDPHLHLRRGGAGRPGPGGQRGRTLRGHRPQPVRQGRPHVPGELPGRFRLLDISDPEAPVEIGWFDTTPYEGDPPGFVGAWTAYPFFESGTVVVTSMYEGVFLLRPRPRRLIP